MPDYHVIPDGDERVHELTRTCWCEPEIRWACDACYVVGVELNGQRIGHEHQDGCTKCGGTGWVTRDNLQHCTVIHDAKDGRP